MSSGFLRIQIEFKSCFGSGFAVIDQLKRLSCYSNVPLGNHSLRGSEDIRLPMTIEAAPRATRGPLPAGQAALPSARTVTPGYTKSAFHPKSYALQKLASYNNRVTENLEAKPAGKLF